MLLVLTVGLQLYYNETNNQITCFLLTAVRRYVKIINMGFPWRTGTSNTYYSLTSQKFYNRINIILINHFFQLSLPQLKRNVHEEITMKYHSQTCMAQKLVSPVSRKLTIFREVNAAYNMYLNTFMAIWDKALPE